MKNSIQSLSCFPDIQEGSPVFSGTRIRFETFVDYMRIGYSVYEFMDEFPSLTFDQVVEAKSLLDEKYSLEQIKALINNPQQGRFQDNTYRGRLTA